MGNIKKIGIITFHFAHNYGAVLQAYAMYEKLRNLKYDPYIIDYRPLYHTSWFKRGISWRSCLSYSFVRIFKNIYIK